MVRKMTRQQGLVKWLDKQAGQSFLAGILALLIDF
jgi:hypothetical protein